LAPCACANAVTFFEFLRGLRRVSIRTGRRVEVITDNAKYHHARLHKDWRERHVTDFELDYLPPYSPDLNPIERVWKLTRRRCLHNRYFANLQEVIEAVEAVFAGWTNRNDNDAAETDHLQIRSRAASFDEDSDVNADCALARTTLREIPSDFHAGLPDPPGGFRIDHRNRRTRNEFPHTDRRGSSLRLELPHDLHAGFHVLHWRLRQDAVSDVEDVTRPCAGALQQLGDLHLQFRQRRE
jgi:transposase